MVEHGSKEVRQGLVDTIMGVMLKKFSVQPRGTKGLIVAQQVGRCADLTGGNWWGIWLPLGQELFCAVGR